MGRKKQPAAAPAAPAAKRTRTSQQQGIAAALAVQTAAAEQPRTDLVLEQQQPCDLLDRWLTDQLRAEGDKYLQE